MAPMALGYGWPVWTIYPVTGRCSASPEGRATKFLELSGRPPQFTPGSQSGFQSPGIHGMFGSTQLGSAWAEPAPSPSAAAPSAAASVAVPAIFLIFTCGLPSARLPRFPQWRLTCGDRKPVCRLYAGRHDQHLDPSCVLGYPSRKGFNPLCLVVKRRPRLRRPARIRPYRTYFR